ncbi:MAG: restriction endonuclease, partial [Planctomycetaceae bacterium]|nr:restriction endonuclease [Planctomycetaceae bacterium]
AKKTAKKTTVVPWDEYERAVLLKYAEDLGAAFQVKGGAKHRVFGRYSRIKRQVDVGVYLGNDSHPRFVVDAKRKQTRKLNVEDVDQFVGKLDDLGVDGGALVCPLGWSTSAERRASKGLVRVVLLSMKDALKISCTDIARHVLPFDWAFLPEWAEALVGLRTHSDPEYIISCIEVMPYEEWLSFVHYAMARHPEEGARVLEHIAYCHYDDAHRYNAAHVLSEHGRLRADVRQHVIDKEWEDDTIESLEGMDVVDE